MSKTGYIYRLTCVNPTIQERYIGSCWDLHTRNRKHRSDCHKPNNGRSNFPVYKFIRENGGYDNWYMVTLDCVDCENHELRNYEQHYIDIHGGIGVLLNHINAVETIEQKRERIKLATRDLTQRNKETKRFYCECCDYAFSAKAKLEKHNNTPKHKQTQQTYDFLSDIENSCIF